jgi:AcrR family transcriptional regulator
MPRNAEDTRELLLDAGRRRFARDGVFQVSLKAIVTEAGQRNASALHYHFGGRQGLLTAIIAVHDDRIETERKEFLAGLDARNAEGLADLVAALVVPFSRALLEPAGREFLLIIAQLSSLFDEWDHPDAPEQARIVFSRIAASISHLPPPLPKLRVTTFLDLVTHALAARARLLDLDPSPELGHDDFVANLVAMCVGALAAPDHSS